MYLHFSFYNYSDLDKNTEWDLSMSGTNISGQKNNFPEVLEHTPVDVFGPPASYVYTGTSSLSVNYIGNIVSPFTITFWVKVGSLANNATIFRTNIPGNLTIGIHKTSKKLTINGIEYFEISSSKYDFIAIAVGGGNIKLFKNGVETGTIANEFLINNNIFTLLENFVGRFSDFSIHKTKLSGEEIEALYRSVFSVNKSNNVFIPLLSTTDKRDKLSNQVKNKIGKNKHFYGEWVNEYSNLSQGFSNLSFTLINESNIQNTPTGGVKKPSPFIIENSLELLDSLVYLEVNIKSSLILNSPKLSAINKTGALTTVIQSRVFNTIPANTKTTLFLLFRSFDKSVSGFEFSFSGSSQPTLEITDVKIVNLTKSWVENYLIQNNISPTYSNGVYSCGTDIINWCDSSFKGKTFSNGSYMFTIEGSSNELNKLFSEDKTTKFSKVWKKAGIIAKEINEFSGL